MTTRSKRNLMSEGAFQFHAQPQAAVGFFSWQESLYPSVAAAAPNQHKQKWKPDSWMMKMVVEVVVVGGDGGDHTYPIVVADRMRRRHLIDPFPLASSKRVFLRGLLRTKVSRISTRPLLMHHRRCVCRNLTASAPFPSAVTA